MAYAAADEATYTRLQEVADHLDPVTRSLFYAGIAARNPADALAAAQSLRGEQNRAEILLAVDPSISWLNERAPESD